MGIFNKIRKALRKGKALPNEHGPVYAFKKEAETVMPANTVVMLTKATTDDKPTTIPSEYAKAVVKKQTAASKAKPVAKKAPAKKAPAKKAPANKKPKTN